MSEPTKQNLLDYQAPVRRPRRRWPWLVLFGAAAYCMVLLSMALLRPTVSRAPAPPTPRQDCEWHMTEIGTDLLHYAGDHDDHFPDTLDDIVDDRLRAEMFVCPASHDVSAAGTNRDALVANLHKPGHLSYIYIGKGLTCQTASAETVLLYEPLANHAVTGLNVLFGDGHAEWVDAKNAVNLLAAVNAAARPVRFNPGTGIVSVDTPKTTP